MKSKELTNPPSKSKYQQIKDSLNKLREAGFTPYKVYASKSVEAEIERSLAICLPRTAPKVKPVFNTIEGVPYAVIDDEGDSFAIIVKPTQCPI